MIIRRPTPSSTSQKQQLNFHKLRRFSPMKTLTMMTMTNAIICLMLVIMMATTTTVTTAFTIPKIHSMPITTTKSTLSKTVLREPTSFVRRKNRLHAHVDGEEQQHQPHHPTTIEPVPTPSSATAVTVNSDASLETTTGVENGRKLINTVLLTLSFGFAIYTILNIDHGMTRGWAPTEIAARIPIDNWASYESSLSAQPIFTKTIINVVIYLLGDWLSQTLFQGKDILDFDAMRTIRNGFVGMCFGPAVHAYYEFSDSILPVEIGYNKFYKIFMDQTIYLGIKCSIYIMAIGLLGGESLADTAKNVRDRIKGIMFTAWKFWPLVHCITYSVVPARHRILWVNSVDLVWNAILASKASGSIEEEEDTDVVIEMNDGLAMVVAEDVIEMKEFANLTTSSFSSPVNGNINGDLNGESIDEVVFQSGNMLELMDDPAIKMENDCHKVAKEEEEEEEREDNADDEDVKEEVLAQVVLDSISSSSSSSKTKFTNSSLVEMKS